MALTSHHTRPGWRGTGAPLVSARPPTWRGGAWKSGPEDVLVPGDQLAVRLRVAHDPAQPDLERTCRRQPSATASWLASATFRSLDLAAAPRLPNVFQHSTITIRRRRRSTSGTSTERAGSAGRVASSKPPAQPPGFVTRSSSSWIARWPASAQIALRVATELEPEVDPERLAERKPDLGRHACTAAGFHVGEPSLAQSRPLDASAVWVKRLRFRAARTASPARRATSFARDSPTIRRSGTLRSSHVGQIDNAGLSAAYRLLIRPSTQLGMSVDCAAIQRRIGALELRLGRRYQRGR